MSYVMVDIEADGPIPGDYSMVCFGAVIVEPTLDRTFYAALAPIWCALNHGARTPCRDELSASFKHLRKTRHTHHPVDDAMGNAEALLRMTLGLKIKL